MNSILLHKHKIEDLRHRAKHFIDILGRMSLGRQLPQSISVNQANIPSLDRIGDVLQRANQFKPYTLNTILNVVQRLLESLHPGWIVEVSPSSDDSLLESLGIGSADGMILEIPVTVGATNKLAYWIVLNKCLNKLNGVAYWRALKFIFLHEISHVLLNHLSAFQPGGGLQNVNPQNRLSVFYRREHGRQELDCDLLAYVLAFWPFEQFRKKVDKVFKDWDGHGDIRLHIANYYKMPIIATVQWMVIMFSDPAYYPYWLHYAWVEVCGGINVIDYYECKDVVNSLGEECTDEVDAVKKIFKNKKTAAYLALDKKRDRKKSYKRIDCNCAAFYENFDNLYNCGHDEVIAIGRVSRT